MWAVVSCKRLGEGVLTCHYVGSTATLGLAGSGTGGLHSRLHHR